MCAINPKCTNKQSFKYSILISLHYHDLKHHPERINQLNKYIHKQSFKSNNYTHFENSNPHISSVNDEYGQLLHQPINKSKIKASIVKINNYRYNALKPNKDKYIQLKELLKQFTHKELTDHLLGKVIY